MTIKKGAQALRMINTTTWILGALLLCAAALAGTSVVAKPGQWVLRQPVGSVINDISRHTTYDECMIAAGKLTTGGPYRCDTSVALTVTVNCDGVAKPVIPRELDADGFYVKPEARAKQNTETDWTTEIRDYVPAPAPTCWVLGWREITQADWNDEYSDVLVQEPVFWPGDEVGG